MTMSGAARPVVLVCAVEAPERSLPGVSAAHWLARSGRNCTSCTSSTR